MATEFDMTGGQITPEPTSNLKPTDTLDGGSDSPFSPKPNPQPQTGIMGLFFLAQKHQERL